MCELIFLRPVFFRILYHDKLPVMIALHFVLADSNMSTPVFCLGSNGSENWLIKFRALGFFIFPNVYTSIGMFSESPSGVETMTFSMMDL